MLPSQLLVFATIGITALVKGWAIDASSCGDISDLLQDTTTKLFAKASKAAYHMSIMDTPTGDPDVRDLSRILFGQDPDKVSKALSKLSSLSSISTYRPGAKGMDLINADFKLYCDTSRLIDSQDGKRSEKYDPDMSTAISKKSVDQCNKGGSEIYAFSNVVYTLKGNQPGRPTAIQICESSLKKVLNQNYKTLSDLRKETWEHLGQKPGSSVMDRIKGNAIIDSLSLLDFTILHEIMHTHCGPESLGDFNHKGKDSASNGYKWKGCANNPYGYKNAESLAFMVFGVELITIHNLRVKENGSLEKIR